MNKKQLYESIMRNVSREVKKVLNETRYGQTIHSNIDLCIDIDDDVYYDNEDDDPIWDVPVKVELEGQTGYPGTRYTPEEQPELYAESITFDKDKYTAKECEIIQKYIDDNYEDIELLAIEKYTDSLDDIRSMMDDDRYKERLES